MRTTCNDCDTPNTSANCSTTVVVVVEMLVDQKVNNSKSQAGLSSHSYSWLVSLQIRCTRTSDQSQIHYTVTNPYTTKSHHGSTINHQHTHRPHTPASFPTPSLVCNHTHQSSASALLLLFTSMTVTITSALKPDTAQTTKA